MGWLFWKRTVEEADEFPDGRIGGKDQVNEQHPLPVSLNWKPEGTAEYLEGDDGVLFPVRIGGSEPVVVVGRGASFTIEVPVSTSPAYTALDNVGGLIELPGVVRVGGKSILLQSLTVTDDRNQQAPLNMVFYNFKPAATFTDNGAFPTMAMTTDYFRVAGIVRLLAADYENLVASRTAIATKANIGLLITPQQSGTSLWLAMATSGTPTYTTVTDLKLTLQFLVN